MDFVTVNGTGFFADFTSDKTETWIQRIVDFPSGRKPETDRPASSGDMVSKQRGFCRVRKGVGTQSVVSCVATISLAGKQQQVL